jgi:UTP--glucose-1-phosphate uridylyltransferase
MTTTKKVRKAVLPVGGMGTRFLPATKAMPKEMLVVVDKPLIQYAVEEARAAGIEEIIFVTGRGKSVIEDHFDHSFELETILAERRKHSVLAELKSILPDEGNIAYLRQQVPLGLGHAVWCARALVGDEPFALLLADDLIKSDPPCLVKMIEIFEETGRSLLAVTEVEQSEVERYGVISPGRQVGNRIEVKGIIEKPNPSEAPSNLVAIGRYILEPKVMEFLAQKRKGTGGEIQLTDALAQLVGDPGLDAYKVDGTRFDCGERLGFLKANIAYALEREDLSERLREYLKSLT